MKKVVLNPISKNIKYYSSKNFFDEARAKNITCYFHSRNAGGLPLLMHTHEFYELNIITNGSGVHFINQSHINVNTGDVFVIKPGSTHGYNEINDLEIFHILINKLFFDKLGDTLERMDGYIALFEIEPRLRNSKISNAFLKLNKVQFQSISNSINDLLSYVDDDIYSNNAKSSIVFQMICNFCKYYHDSLHSSTHKKQVQAYTPVIIQVLEYMERNLAQKLTIDKIAETFYISKSTLIRNFTNTMGEPPINYLIKLRIKKATTLLENTNKTITTIALECGFYDASHFEHYFYKYNNISPSNYRTNIIHGQK
ncbi:MAG: helix-turn-helix domain-containing protein [Clostridia bacterium]|nr:helix-turn-helix domain-containing protein [Clostridia bacterium]